MSFFEPRRSMVDMDWDGKNNVLRGALDLPDGTLSSEHSSKIEDIRISHPHSVLLVQETGGLTCVPYALGLADNALYRAVASDFDGEIFAGADFVSWLLDGRLNEVNKSAQHLLCLYFSNGEWRHIGRITEPGRVASKWGMFPIYDHSFWEVPIRYGNRLRFFEKPSRSRAIDLFLEYARSAGVCDKDIDDIAAEVEK